MPTRDVVPWLSQLETTCIFVSPPCKVWRGLGSKASLLLDILVHFWPSRTTCWCAWCVPCISAQEMFEGTCWCRCQWCCTSQGWSVLSWALCEAVRSVGSGHDEKDDSLLQGLVEPPFWRRSHVGDRGFPSFELSRFSPSTVMHCNLSLL
jgi:hypothetical protein